MKPLKKSNIRKKGFRTLKEGNNLPHLNIRFSIPYEPCNYFCEYCITRGYKKDTLQWLVRHLLNPKDMFFWLRSYFKSNVDSLKAPVWDENNYLKIIDALKEIPYKISVRLDMIGEFFINKTLIKGARRLSQSKNCRAINITTNLSFSFESYSRILKGFDLKKISVVGSYHPTQIKDKQAWLRTAEKMNQIVDFTSIVVAWPPFIDQLAEIKSMFINRNLPVFIQAFNGYYKGKKYPESYTAKERKILRGLFYSRHDYEHMVNLKKPGICYAGVDYINIDMNGNVFRCGNVLAPLGNILSGDYRLLKSAGPCPSPICWCDTDSMNTKRFRENYEVKGIHKHKYVYKHHELAKKDPALSEWNIEY